MRAIDEYCWPTERLAEGIEALARRLNYPLASNAEILTSPPEPFDEDAWLELASGRLGLEVEAVQVVYPELALLLKHVAPAVLSLKQGYLLLLGSSFGRLRVLTPDLSIGKLPLQHATQAMSKELEDAAAEGLTQVLEAVDIPPERRDRALRVLLQERLGNTQVAHCWLLRLPPSASFWRQLRQAGLWRQLASLLGAHACYQGLQIAAWWLIVWAVFNNSLQQIGLGAWALILLTAVPLSILVWWSQSQLTMSGGALMKQRLLFGALQLRPEEIRHQGLGQFLGRVLEAETLETLVLGGGFNAAIAVVELLTAAVVLGLGVGGLLHVALLLLWAVIAGVIAWAFYERSSHWRSAHRYLINTLIERMVGHRTRLAQEPIQDWHDDEDQLQARYLAVSKAADRSAVQMAGLLTRGWLILGLAGMAYPLLSGQFSMTSIALSLGGVMLAAQAWNHLALGLESLIGVINAWRQIGPLFRAAPRINQEPLGIAATLTNQTAPESAARPIFVAKDITFRYRASGQPVLNQCSLSIAAGDRLLLQGSSGGGKSTLASILAGLRQPSSGLLMLRGLDRQTLGTRAWRQKIVAVPQFHENHVLAETLAFNLLMGRRWPPNAEDLQEAEVLCAELGLGELLQRMPAGLHQMVGESGWQLSHGERSRLFIARALLQNADLIILDESFAALDPANLERALRCVLRRSPALLVIAHP